MSVRGVNRLKCQKGISGRTGTIVADPRRRNCVPNRTKRTKKKKKTQERKKKQHAFTRKRSSASAAFRRLQFILSRARAAKNPDARLSIDAGLCPYTAPSENPAAALSFLALSLLWYARQELAGSLVAQYMGVLATATSGYAFSR